MILLYLPSLILSVMSVALSFWVRRGVLEDLRTAEKLLQQAQDEVSTTNRRALERLLADGWRPPE